MDTLIKKIFNIIHNLLTFVLIHQAQYELRRHFND